jgi:predicted DNA-binding protein with PD1-like motif
MKTFEGAAAGALIITLSRGEDLHDGILAGCRAHGVRDAVIVSGVATLSPVVLHDVTTESFPIGEHVRTLDGPWELVALSGLVLDGELHAHLAVANSETSIGGHLHPGSGVLYLAEVVLVGLRISGPALRREHEAGTNLWLIREDAAVSATSLLVAPPPRISPGPLDGGVQGV